GRAGEGWVVPLGEGGAEAGADWISGPWMRGARFSCEYADGLAQQVALGEEIIEVRGMLSPEVEARLMHQYIVELTAHEVGHTLGLRHNFRGSTILKNGDLNDVKKTGEIGQSGSVMDYNPVIIAKKGQVQGDFLPVTLGPY